MRFGLCADIRNVLEVQAAGYDYIEGKLNQFALWSDEEFESVLELFSSAEIKMETVSLLLPKSMTVIGDKFSKVELMTFLDRAFARMDALDSKLVVFGSGKSRNRPENMPYGAAFRRLAEVARLTGKIAAKYGLTIALEPLDGEETNIINTASEGFRWVRNLDLPYVRILPDLFHMAMEKEDPNVLVQNENLIVHLHASEAPGRVFPGKFGGEYLKKCGEVLRSFGWTKDITVECVFSDFESEADMALKFMKEAFE